MIDRAKRTARRTKVEMLPVEERIFLSACFDAGMTLTAAVEAYQKKFGKHLAVSTFHSWLMKRRLPEKAEAEKAIEAAAEFARLRKKHPDIPEDVLLRGFLRQRLASEEFRQSAVSPEVVIRGEIGLQKLDVEKDRVKAIERHNELEEHRQELKEQELQDDRAKRTAAAGGFDPRELYLRAAQDVLKKLHTYKDLKAPLDARQEEVVAELAHSAEAFARKLEHES